MSYDEILCNYRMNSVGRVQKTGNTTDAYFAQRLIFQYIT